MLINMTRAQLYCHKSRRHSSAHIVAFELFELRQTNEIHIPAACIACFPTHSTVCRLPRFHSPRMMKIPFRRWHSDQTTDKCAWFLQRGQCSRRKSLARANLALFVVCVWGGSSRIEAHNRAVAARDAQSARDVEQCERQTREEDALAPGSILQQLYSATGVCPVTLFLLNSSR
jgi:hypothetical protein